MSNFLGTIETDAPCEACGFNLHGQRIWRDERLDLPLARCPECGRHHAVGRTTTAASAWLGRLAVLGLLVWLAIGITFVLASLGVCLALQAGASEIFLQRVFETTDGRPVYMTWSHQTPQSPGPKWATSPTVYRGHEIEMATAEEAKRLVPDDQVVFRVKPSHIVYPPPGVSYHDHLRGETYWALALIVGGSALAVFVLGAIAASASWFWRPRWRAAWLLLPVLALLVMAVIEWTNLGQSYGTRVARDGGVRFVGVGLIGANLAVVAALQMLCLALGLWFGRSIAQRLILIFIPPRARQAFAFLWHCDGKTMPHDYVPRSNR